MRHEHYTIGRLQKKKSVPGDKREGHIHWSRLIPVLSLERKKGENIFLIENDRIAEDKYQWLRGSDVVASDLCLHQGLVNGIVPGQKAEILSDLVNVD